MAGLTVAPEWLRPEWAAPDRVRALATTRAGGCSTGDHASLNLGAHVGDPLARVVENRRALHRAADLPSQPRWLKQLHGTNVVRAEETRRSPEADAAWTDAPGVVCAVLTADCLPVLFCDRGARAVAAAHAGWRGLSSGILRATVDTLRAQGIAPGELMAWLGPAISANAYEVDAPVRDAFAGRLPGAESCFTETRPGHWACDLYGLARLELGALGVQDVSGGKYCTHSDARFFSYRRSPRCGRQATLIWLE